MMNKSYTELMSIPSFDDRYRYLKLNGVLGKETFGDQRYLNQMLYSSDIWKKTRRQIVLRDDGFDLAHQDYPIGGYIYVHHINPITPDDILEQRPIVFDPENLISTSYDTHIAIHYGFNMASPRESLVVRKPNDTCPWK